MSIGYLSLNGMANVFSQWADADPNINQFGYGQLFNENGVVRAKQIYPGTWINPVRTEMLSDWALQRVYEVLIYDLVYVDSTTGESNQNKIVSDCEEVAFRLIRFLKHKSDVFDIVSQPTIQPFSDKWLDSVSGVIVSITVVFNAESANCEDPDYSFDIKTNQI